MSRSITQVVAEVQPLNHPVLEQPPFVSLSHRQQCLGLAVASMADHMSDEGWQLFYGLREAGYKLCGSKVSTAANSFIDYACTDVAAILESQDVGTIVLQDKREWGYAGNRLCRIAEYYSNYQKLREQHNVFKVTVLKDAHSHHHLNIQTALEIGCHAWIVYYHPSIIKAQCPYVREQHLIRTYHTVNPAKVPFYQAMNRAGCLLSGDMNHYHYPLRHAILQITPDLPEVYHLGHPGYHNRATNTNNYLEYLSRFKVAICTSSRHGYSLRKIIEATACGCCVITDLPVDDVLPEIDGNLVRIDLHPRETLQQRLTQLLLELYNDYHPEKQKHFSNLAKSYYSVTNQGKLLRDSINRLRKAYSS